MTKYSAYRIDNNFSVKVDTKQYILEYLKYFLKATAEDPA